jgi:hypothetical protein
MPENRDDERVRIVLPPYVAARAFVAMLRDLCLVAVFVAMLVMGGRVLSVFENQSVTPGPAGVLPCPTPTSDDFGTFCPDDEDTPDEPRDEEKEENSGG